MVYMENCIESGVESKPDFWKARWCLRVRQTCPREIGYLKYEMFKREIGDFKYEMFKGDIKAVEISNGHFRTCFVKFLKPFIQYFEIGFGFHHHQSTFQGFRL